MPASCSSGQRGLALICESLKPLSVSADMLDRTSALYLCVQLFGWHICWRCGQTTALTGRLLPLLLFSLTRTWSEVVGGRNGCRRWSRRCPQMLRSIGRSWNSSRPDCELQAFRLFHFASSRGATCINFITTCTWHSIRQWQLTYGYYCDCRHACACRLYLQDPHKMASRHCDWRSLLVPEHFRAAQRQPNKQGVRPVNLYARRRLDRLHSLPHLQCRHGVFQYASQYMEEDPNP